MLNCYLRLDIYGGFFLLAPYSSYHRGSSLEATPWSYVICFAYAWCMSSSRHRLLTALAALDLRRIHTRYPVRGSSMCNVTLGRLSNPIFSTMGKMMATRLYGKASTSLRSHHLFCVCQPSFPSFHPRKSAWNIVRGSVLSRVLQGI